MVRGWEMRIWGDLGGPGMGNEDLGKVWEEQNM